MAEVFTTVVEAANGDLHIVNTNQPAAIIVVLPENIQKRGTALLATIEFIHNQAGCVDSAFFLQLPLNS